MNKLLKCFQVMEEVDTVILIPDNLHLETMEVIVVLKLLEMDIGHKIPATLSISIVDFIILVLMVEAEIGLKRPTTITISITDQELVLKGEVDICIIPATIPPIIQVNMVDC